MNKQRRGIDGGIGDTGIPQPLTQILFIWSLPRPTSTAKTSDLSDLRLAAHFHLDTDRKQSRPHNA